MPEVLFMATLVFGSEYPERDEMYTNPKNFLAEFSGFSGISLP